MNNSESAFQKHVPVFPLPEEILNMSRDETICQFCGVSYLIHNEIKKLEDKIKDLEEKLKDYDLMKHKISNYDRINDDLSLKAQDLEEKLADRIRIISSLNNDMESKNIEQNRLRKKIEELENENYVNIANMENLKNKLLKYESVVKETELKLSSQKSDLKLIELKTKDQLSLMMQYVNSIRSQMDKYTQKISKDSLDKNELENNLKSQIRELIRENDSYKETINSSSKQISSFQEIKNELETQITILKSQVNQSNELSSKFVNFEKEKRVLLEENSKLKNEMEKNKLNSNNMVVENSELNEKLAILNEKLDQMNLKFLNEIKSKNDEINRYKNELGQMKKRYEDQEKFESDLVANNQSNLSEINRLKFELNKARDQANDLENEIKSMTLAHQCQITQIKDSFRDKMKKNDEWPDKLELELKKERERHSLDIQKLENDLKQNFKMELEIHNQKYDELYIKYQKMISDNENISKSSLAKLESENRNLANELKNVHEEKLKNERKLKQDLENLRTITKDLHERLEKYTNDDEASSSNTLKQKLAQKDFSINELETRLKQSESQVEAFKDEIKILQETVHNECLEREELLEKLDKARDELLILKKNTYASQQLIPLNTSINKSPKNQNRQTLIDVDYAKNLNELDSQKLNISHNSTMNRRNSTPNPNLNRTGSEKSQPESISKVVDSGRLQRTNMLKKETISLLNSNNNSSNEPIQLFKKINELSNITNKPKSNNQASSLLNSSNAENKKRISLLLARKS